MAWIFLFIAGLTEVIWSVALKQSHGFSRIVPSITTIVFMVVSLYLLSLSMRTVPLGTAYVIWTGIGAVGAFIVGILYFNEPTSMARFLAAGLIVSGLLLMKLTSPT